MFVPGRFCPHTSLALVFVCLKQVSAWLAHFWNGCFVVYFGACQKYLTTNKSRPPPATVPCFARPPPPPASIPFLIVPLPHPHRHKHRRRRCQS